MNVEGGREGVRLSMIIYLILIVLVDELHGLAVGRNIIKNLHMAGKQGLKSGLQNMNSKYEEPLFDVKELRSIAPTDHKQQFDIYSFSYCSHC